MRHTDPDCSDLKTMPPSLDGVPIKRRRLADTTTVACIDGGAVFLNILADAAWKDMPAYVERAYAAGWHSSAHRNHIVYRGLAAALDGKDPERGLLSPEQLEAAQEVSSSAAVSAAEFIAEVYAGVRAGREFSGRVLACYAALDGPALKFNPNHAPGGAPDGGQFTSSGDGGGAGSSAANKPQAGQQAESPADAALALLKPEHLSKLGPKAAVDLKNMYRAAAEVKGDFDAAIKDVAKATNGEAKIPGLKGGARATEKILHDYAGDATKIKDIVRATIEVKTVAEAQDALAKVRSKFEVLTPGFRNTLTPEANPADGYRDIKMNVRMKGGVVGEVQINLPSMLAAKSENHVLYEERRSLEGSISSAKRNATPAESSTIARMNGQMKTNYDKAWQAALPAKPIRRDWSIGKFNPNHAPSGGSDGGQFTSDGAGGGASGGTASDPAAADHTATDKERKASLKQARKKIADAPVPTKEEVAKARADLANAARAGGDSRGGSAASRRAQRENLFKEFGGEERGYVVCPWTGLKMSWTDDPKINPNGYPKFERGKIFTKVQGGGYQLPNLIPESFAANRSRNDKPIRPENLR